MLGFILWAACGLLFISFGLHAFAAQKAVGFWANSKPVSIRKVKAYNRAVGKLWCVSGLLFLVLGLPLLAGQNTPFALLSVLGCFLWVIALMLAYTRIERKYLEK